MSDEAKDVDRSDAANTPGTYELLVDWDRILSETRRAFPRLGSYGDVVGGETTQMLDFFRDDKLVSMAAQAIWKADNQLKAATSAACETILAAEKKHRAAMDMMRENLKTELARRKRGMSPD